jgi:hypothetical protein
MRRHLLVGCSVLGLTIGAAQANDLYFAMPINYDQFSTSETLFVYGNAGIQGTVSSPNGFNTPFTIGANNVTSVVLSPSDDLTISGLVTDNGFLVSTNNAADKVGASYLSRQTATTDTTYLLDSTALGTNYYGVGYGNNIGYPSQLSLVGTADNTVVTITPSTNFAGGQLANLPFTVTLNAGQAVLYTDSGSGDITGTHVTSTAPIAVFGGNQCVDIPAGQYACDHVLTALPDVSHYTKSAVVLDTVGVETPSTNIVRVLASADGTTVKYNGVTQAILNAGQFVDFRASGGGGLVTADQDVVVNEYLTGEGEHTTTVGDPAMSYIPGSDQWLDAYVFSTPVGTQSYVTNFLDIAIPSTAVGSLMLNGVGVSGSDCSALAGAAGYSACEIAIDPGAGNISASDPFLLLIDGGTDYDSYFTFAGATFSAGASPPPNNPPPATGVPEPLTVSLFGAGLVGAFAARRRKAKKA